MAPERTKQFKMLLSDEEDGWLRTLAESAGLSASDYLRQYIRKTHDSTRGALTIALELWNRLPTSIAAGDVAKVLSARWNRPVADAEVEATLVEHGWYQLRSGRFRPPPKADPK